MAGATLAPFTINIMDANHHQIAGNPGTTYRRCMHCTLCYRFRFDVELGAVVQPYQPALPRIANMQPFAVHQTRSKSTLHHDSTSNSVKSIFCIDKHRGRSPGLEPKFRV
jgi:hypothetical protein